MPQNDPQTPFYRPDQSAGCRLPRISSAESALKQIVGLIDMGTPKSLPEAGIRLSAVRLIALEGLGNETVFEMVCRIMAEDGVTV